MSSSVAHGPFRVERPFGRLYGEIEGDGKPIVFAHGLGGNQISWFQQVAHLRVRYRCIAFAHRGFAPSDPVAGGPDPTDYAGDLLALLDQLGVERAVIVAQSMGGWTATSFALAHPERVAGIVMACTTGVFDYRQARHPAMARLDEWKARARREGEATTARGVHPAAGIRMAEEQPALELLYRQIDRVGGLHLDKLELRRRLFAAMALPPERLAAIVAPMLFVAGGEDPVIPSCGVEAVAASAPRGRFEEVPAAGHSVYFERPERFNQLLDGFLAEIGW